MDAGNEGDPLFEIARVYLPTGEQLPEERWQVGGIAEGGFAAARGRSRRSTRRSISPLEPAGRRSPTSIRARPPQTERAGSASSTRRCSKAPGVHSSSTSTRLMAPLPERILYEDVITFPPSGRTSPSSSTRTSRPGRSWSTRAEAAGAELREARVFDVYHGDQVGEGEVRRGALSPSRRPTGRSPTTDAACARDGS